MGAGEAFALIFGTSGAFAAWMVWREARDGRHDVGPEDGFVPIDRARVGMDPDLQRAGPRDGGVAHQPPRRLRLQGPEAPVDAEQEAAPLHWPDADD